MSSNVSLTECEYRDRLFGSVVELRKYRDEHTRFTLSWAYRIFRDEVLPVCLTVVFFCGLVIVTERIVSLLSSPSAEDEKVVSLGGTESELVSRESNFVYMPAGEYEDNRPKFKEMLESLPSFPGADVSEVEVMEYNDYLASVGRAQIDVYQTMHANCERRFPYGASCFSQEEYVRCVQAGRLYVDVAKKFYAECLGYKLTPQDLARFNPPLAVK
jgi:hypothetical protein